VRDSGANEGEKGRAWRQSSPAKRRRERHSAACASEAEWSDTVRTANTGEGETFARISYYHFHEKGEEKTAVANGSNHQSCTFVTAG
jgi:hypothetical protein